MLMLLFSVGEDRYALDCKHVVEIIPMVEIKKMLKAPEYIAGIFNYRGKSVPIVDLCRLMLGRYASHRLSTRVVLVEQRIKNQVYTLGFLAEKMTETVKIAPKELVVPGVNIESLPFLGKLFKIGEEMIQCVEMDKLLSFIQLQETGFLE